MKVTKLSKQKKLELDAIKHSRPRTLMPRPAVFTDKTKYNRKALKNRDWKQIKSLCD